MIALSHKSKHYGLIALKVLILSLTFGYIYQKLQTSGSLSFSDFIHTIVVKDAQRWPWWLLFSMLAVINWMFEILKWQTVVSMIESISFRTAMTQSLAALTVSLATPNRIGDYGAKAIYYAKNQQKQILLVNFFSNAAQMLITIVFGVFGLYIITQQLGFSLSFSNSTLLIFGCTIIVWMAYHYRAKEFFIKGCSLVNIFNYFREIPKEVIIKTVVYSIIRYLVFSSLFFLLLRYYNAPVTFATALPIIFAMYLLVSVIPSFFMLDVVVRGGVALWLFSQVGVSELTVLSTVLAMWVLNFVVPAVWGSFYVITFKRT